jgi:pentatricopeptide repeat protein
MVQRPGAGKTRCSASALKPSTARGVNWWSLKCSRYTEQPKNRMNKVSFVRRLIQNSTPLYTAPKSTTTFNSSTNIFHQRFYSLTNGNHSEGILAIRQSLKAQNHLDAWQNFVSLSPAEVSRLNEEDVGLLVSTFLKTDKLSDILKSIRDSHGGEGLSLSDFQYIAQQNSVTSNWTLGESIAFLNAMKQEGVEPDITLYESLIDGLVYRDPVGARKLMEEQQPAGSIPPTGKMYLKLASAFVRQGDPDAAAQTIQDMVACEIKPDNESLVNLLNELLSKGHEDLATQISNSIAGAENAMPSFGSEGERP